MQRQVRDQWEAEYQRLNTRNNHFVNFNTILQSCCPSSRIRPNNSWVRGTPVPPEPPKHIRQTPFSSIVRTPGTLPHTGPRYQPEIERYYGQRQRSSGFGSKSSFDQNKRYKIVRPTKYGSQFVSGFGYQSSVRSGMGKRSMSEPNLDYLFAEPTRYRNSPLKRSLSGGQLSRGFHRKSSKSYVFICGKVQYIKIKIVCK
jgi:hypothetical protein